jgi:hypothetical protein
MSDARLTAVTRRTVAARSGGFCEYCRSPQRFCPESFSVEHVTPRSRGGDDDLENLAYSCQGCNNCKYNRAEGPDPISGAIVRFFHPRRDLWAEHFEWDPTYTNVLGMTPTGRATVIRLQLNREGLRNLRRLLYSAGLHPPADSPLNGSQG